MTWPIDENLPAKLVIPGIAAFARADRPETPVPNDGNPWVTGRCWLYCRRDNVLVIWIGPVTVVGATAAMFACATCISRLNDLLWDELLVGTTAPAPELPAPAAPVAAAVTLTHRPAARRPVLLAPARTSHRRPRKRSELLGATLPGWLSRLSRRARTELQPASSSYTHGPTPAL
ncbi:hypothetical protein ACIRPK_33390 [Kitasatospora sp. NPDC101801]|uniref:hypothetical protein n=1 Tax=Kitasatospora sp. NPDC101801 TaxID=3364103 RepID=UPI00381BE174